MLIEAFWWNPILHEVSDKGCCIPSIRSSCQTVPLDSSLGLQLMVKLYFSGNRDVWWVFVDSGSKPLLFCVPTR